MRFLNFVISSHRMMKSANLKIDEGRLKPRKPGVLCKMIVEET